MKTTLDWYSRNANSYNAIGERMLIKKHGHAGAYKYIMICDNLVTLHNCCLNIKSNDKFLKMLALDLDFNPDQLTQFINDLLEYELLYMVDANNISTKEIQESLAIAMERREKDRARKNPNLQHNSNLTPKNDTFQAENNNFQAENENSTEKTKNSTKKNNRERERDNTDSTYHTERENFAQKVFTKDFLKEIEELTNQQPEKIESKQTEFLKYFKATQKKWKNSDDFRSHFINWLNKELEKEKNSAKKEKETTNYNGMQDYD